MGILHQLSALLLLLPSNKVILISADFPRNAVFCHFTACRMDKETSYFYECGLYML